MCHMLYWALGIQGRAKRIQLSMLQNLDSIGEVVEIIIT